MIDTENAAPGPVIQRNTAEAAEPSPPPSHPDNRPWRFEMIYGGGAWRAYADTPEELLAALIPGYQDLTQPTQRSQARLLAACNAQVRWQAAVSAHMGTQDCSAEHLSVLLGNFSTPPVLEQWDAPIPLLLIRAFYAPHQPPAPPTGNVLWLDTSDDWALLTSFAEAGVVNLHVLEDDLPPAAPDSVTQPPRDQEAGDGRG